MASSISAGTTSSTALVATADTSGALELKTNNGTTAVTIDTNQRTAFVAGTAALPAITTTGDTNTGIFFPAADTIAFSEGGAESMRIDSTGEVLVGNTTASQTMDGLFVRGKRTATGNQYNFLVYTQGGGMSFACRDDNYVRSPSMYSRTSGGAANVFVDSSGYLYRSTSSIKYKRDVTDYDKGVSTVMQLRPVYYKSKVNDPDGNQIDTQYAGFIAEEVDALGLDEFVVKNTEGEVEAIHYGNMVALLTKTIQEQQALITQQAAAIEALTTRITALEGTPA